jgi:hypothetical protein
VGESRTVEWSSAGLSGQVQIRIDYPGLSRTLGWTDIAAGSFTFTVPNVAARNDWHAVVTWYGSNPGSTSDDVWDVSDQFSIQPAGSAAWCSTSLDFSSSTLPSGWTLTAFGSGPFFNNGRLQAPQGVRSVMNVPRIDAAGSLPAGTQEVVVEYDGNLAPSGADQSEGRGQGRVTSFVMADGWSFEGQEFNDRYGVNVHSFRAQKNIPQWPEPGSTYTQFNIASTSGVPYGQYHFKAVFRDGQVTWTGSQGGTVTMGPLVQPLTGFALSNVRSFSLGVGSALAEAAWVDNLTVRCQ